MDTLTRQPRRRRRRADAAPVPTLTVLAHPDVRRVGDRAQLPALGRGEAVALSRKEPGFCSPDGVETGALEDPWLSRRPATLQREGAVVTLSPGGSPLTVDGRPGAARVPMDALREGVVVELSDRVALLLHEALPAGLRQPALGLVGGSDCLERVRAELLNVADLDVPVLLRGASGTGKELVARALHDRSGRQDRAFLALNMAAIPPTTAASELFGHARGAFTGAARDREGHFQRADGGTLFLDEIGEAPAEVQVALLRALESGEVQPVGGAPARVDVRLVAATDANLEAAAEEGRFRVPLLHRLAVYELHLPPLRARRDDIGRLAVHFIRGALDEFGERPRLDRPTEDPWLPSPLIARMARAPWPGNVRQLRNACRQLVIASRGAREAVVPPALERALAATPEAVATAEPGDADVLEALKAHRWKISAAADALGLSRPALYRRIDRSDVIRKANEVSEAELRAALETAGGSLDQAAEALEVSPRGLRLRARELGVG
ncbi:MAG: sigma-54-dependent Fis family transcriptional regulator [Alphaproteobacteria bacterium]|nr:sigma-54-dependent Fis family transcriptional regulator [Alphaproteobacteria bacterium]